jgi:EAL domain-containing protein (putative c-di-GMP-specific phosphodiesterase class I)/GGDEF domain-containing protein
VQSRVHPDTVVLLDRLATDGGQAECDVAVPRACDENQRVAQPPGQDVEHDLDRQIYSYSQRFDVQTGLLNHQAFQDGLAAMLRHRADGSEVALIWIDLVNLRREFALWGWTGAEALARRVAGALRSVVDSNGLLGRVGGRSFLVAMEAGKHDKEGRRRIQVVVDALAPARHRGLDTRTQAATARTEAATRPEVVAGVAFFPVDTESIEDLVRFASLAAMRAGQGKSQAVVAFHAGMNSMMVRNHALEVEMRKGFERGQFELAYQPKIDLHTGEILGAEALTRWTHPQWGAVTPGEFIPVSERSDLIHRIFEFGLRAALEQLQQWRDMGLRLPVIAVNASAANVRSDSFVLLVRSIIGEFPPGSTEVELEMTESLAFEDEELFAARMQQLKGVGVRIAIDDFGTRYTGFNVLKHLPLDTMKIDQCFIRGIDRSLGMRSLCETIVAMARQLKLRIVAEGIEELGELEAMRAIGCEAGQGYLFQRPVDAEHFAEFLRTWPERSHGFGFAHAALIRLRDPLCGIA